MTASDTLLITNKDVQTDLVDYTKTLSAVVALLPSSAEVRELEWQGTDFQYPNVRVSVDLFPSINGCAPYRAEIKFDCFAEDKFSDNAQAIAGAIQKAYHRVPFSINGRIYSSSIVTQVTKAQRSIYAWVSSVSITALVN